jgi:hypothetical protein
MTKRVPTALVRVLAVLLLLGAMLRLTGSAGITNGQEDPLVAQVHIEPDSLNLETQGQEVTVRIEPPAGHDARDIVVNPLRVGSTAPLAWAQVSGRALLAKVNRQSLVVLIRLAVSCQTLPGDIDLEVAGEFAQGASFVGWDAISYSMPAARRDVNSDCPGITFGGGDGPMI